MSKIGPAEKRVRIGLTLAPDVAIILNKYGRSDTDLYRCSCGEWHRPNRIPCGQTEPLRPTRTQIIEEAVREWRERRLPTAAQLLGSDPDFTGELSTKEYIDQIRGRESDPEAEQQAEPTAVREWECSADRSYVLGAAEPSYTPTPLTAKELQESVSAGVEAAVLRQATGEIDAAQKRIERVSGAKVLSAIAGTEDVRANGLSLRDIVSAGIAQNLSTTLRRASECPHPAGKRTAGTEWRCTGCGFQQKVAK